jgi:hypothetical protein
MDAARHQENVSSNKLRAQQQRSNVAARRGYCAARSPMAGLP